MESSSRPFQVWDEGGRGGYVLYAEEGAGTLRFWREFMAFGVMVTVPTIAEWDGWCERGGDAWARGRRDEIIDRLVDGLLRDRARGCTVRRSAREIEFHC